jgi:phosphoribosylaminoimidazolecarboxamide formyltransferase/IMP cyclohydrolase
MDRDDAARDGITAPAEAVPIAVCVSGQGSNLVALLHAERRGRLGARVTLVVADRECPALGHAARAGIATAIVRPADHPDAGAWDRALAATLRGSGARLVVLAGFMRVVGPATLAEYAGRMLNVHPALLPAFPGAHAVRDALAAGVRQTGVTVHLVDEVLDGGPIVLQEPVPVLADDDEDRLLARVHVVEHRLLPRAVALAAAGALRLDGGRVCIDTAIAAAMPPPRRALLSVSDKSGLLELGRGLDALGFELVSTGGTARALRDAGLDVTDVSAVTGFPEMLDGRVKTLHPRIEAGVLADLRLASHREQLAAAGIEPFQLVVVNLYPFAAAAATAGIGTDELIEQIDIGGPTLVRAAAKNHASVAVVTDPAAYPAVLDELRAGGSLGEGTRRRLAVEAFRHTAAYDARIAEELPARLGAVGGESAGGDSVAAAGSLAQATPSAGRGPAPLPERLNVALERVQLLRYGENPHQAAALYRRPGTSPETGLFASGVDLRQGKPLSYNNLLDAAAAAGLARDLHGPACVIVKHTNPCGAAETDDVEVAWERALAGDPVSAFGGVVAITRAIDAGLAGRLTSLFLEVVVAPAIDADALPILARKPNLRVVIDPFLGGAPGTPVVELRSAGGGVLATESDTRPDDPLAWQVATARGPTAAEHRDLDLAWRIVRHVKSNAIVLVHDAMLVGCGAGQQSRVDSARLAIAKAGADRAAGAACGSDAFFPFPDGVEVCLEAGVTAFVQPGGSVRDAEVIAAADAAGATMLLTGRRHFRH